MLQAHQSAQLNSNMSLQVKDEVEMENLICFKYLKSSKPKFAFCSLIVLVLHLAVISAANTVL